MASSYSELKFELIATGEQSGTWGSTTNDNIGTAINEAIAGMAMVTINGNTTLTWLNTVASQQARHFVLQLTPGSVAAPFNLVVPTIQKPYVVINNTAHAATVKTSAGSGVVVPPGKTTPVYTNGVNVVEMFNHVPALTVGSLVIETTPLAMSGGGTGSNSISAGIVTSDGTVISSTPAPSGDLVGTTAGQALSNKEIQPRVLSNPDYPTGITPTSSYDMAEATSQTTTSTTLNANAGSYNGQKFIFRITAASNINISYSTSTNGYRPVGVSVPFTLPNGYTLYVGCIWNSLISKWDIIAVNSGI